MIITVAVIAETTAKMDADPSKKQSRRIYCFLGEVNTIFHTDIQRCKHRTTAYTSIRFLESTRKV